jgi:kinesin family protein 18/19
MDVDNTLKKKIYISIRFKPFLSNEKKEINCLRVEENSILVNMSKTGIKSGDGVKEEKFSFDKVFNFNCTNEEVFKNTTEVLVRNIFSGFNGCCFCYGSSSSGKTYTMMGNQFLDSSFDIVFKGIFSYSAELVYDIVKV